MSTRLMVSLAVTLLLSACATNGRIEPAPRSERGSRRPSVTGTTELWAQGAIGTPHVLKPLGAKGGRGVVDLRKFSVEPARRHLRQYVDLDMGVCMTVRWRDPDGHVHEDKPPTEVESVAKLDQLMAALTSPEAKRLDGRLWIQFYNELATGAARIDPSEGDGMFDFATRAVERIRAEAPHVRICGPAMTGVSPGGPIEELNPRRRAIVELNRRILEWSARYADAVDVHLHTGDIDRVRERLESMRRYLDELPGGKRLQLVVWEWSPAFYPDRDNHAEIRALMHEIWHVMNEHNVAIAAYGSVYPEIHFGDTFGWQALFVRKGKPNEPFHSTFRSIAERVTSGRRAGGDEPDGGP